MNVRWLSLFSLAVAFCFPSKNLVAQNQPGDPFARWEKAISDFENDDKKNGKEPGQVLFIGSSSIRLWDLDKWFPDLDAINRGFGGSEVADSVHFYDRIVKPYAPTTIVMYAGDNDLSRGKTPEQVLADFQEFVEKVHADFPRTEIIYVAVKPSIARWKLVGEVRKTNELIKQMASDHEQLIFLDIDTPMIGENGTPKPELFAIDGLHLSEAGYKLWSDLLRTHLEDEIMANIRLRDRRDIYDAYHPWTPPTSLDVWKVEAEQIRRQLLVSNGLWPLPKKTPLDAVIHGKIDQGDYTIEKVYFRSRPGHYVTGNLYRPKNVEGKVPGILCPHGHWKDGRFYDAGKGAADQIKSTAEEFEAGAHSPLQARMVQLARMGCVVFHYDMIGYADSQPLDHRTGFNDANAALWLHNIMGLQTWNSIRCLDFIESLPDVDPDRLAVTGASGGGTQAMILAAIDERVTAAFPAVMVSTGMQGGCVCENASYMRHGVNNVAFAALFAPKPQAMSGADDWTIEIETKGLPELKQVYSLYDKPLHVHAFSFPQFKHNFNQVAREFMYNWFNVHLDLNLETPVKQTDFQPLTPEELSVFNETHPLPADALVAKELRELMIAEDQNELKSWRANPQQFREIVKGAADIMLSPDIGQVDLEESPLGLNDSATISVQTASVSYQGGAVVPIQIISKGIDTNGIVYWFSGEPLSSEISDEVKNLAEAGFKVIKGEVFATAENAEQFATLKVNRKYPGYSYCYNEPLITERVQDILAVMQAIPTPEGKKATLLGDGAAGLWTLLAASVTQPERCDEIIIDLENFRFRDIDSISDPNLLPGALKYGGVSGLASLIDAKSLKIFGIANVSQFEESFVGKETNSQTATFSSEPLDVSAITGTIVSAE